MLQLVNVVGPVADLSIGVDHQGPLLLFEAFKTTLTVKSNTDHVSIQMVHRGCVEQYCYR